MNRKIFRILAILAIAPILKASEIQTELEEYRRTIVDHSNYDPKIVIKYFKKSIEVDIVDYQTLRIGHAIIKQATHLLGSNKDISVDQRNYNLGRLHTYFSYYLEQFDKRSNDVQVYMEIGKQYIRGVASNAQDQDLKQRALFFGTMIFQ